MDYSKMDWELLRAQKRGLVAMIDELANAGKTAEFALLDGILNIIDAIQDDAESRGYPVLYDTEEEEPQCDAE